MSSGSFPHLSIGHNSSSEPSIELPDSDVVEEFLHSDAEKLRKYFASSYDKIRSEMNKPHVLIAGATGAGKSSIINSIFGGETAKEGAGKPITQNFTKYDGDNQPIVLFDSKGLEAGMQFDNFLEETLNFFSNNEDDIQSEYLDTFNTTPIGLEKKIHLVWYVINSASTRFQDFEERVCKELFGRLPIIFLLNKSDISTNEQLTSLRKVINDLNLQNCIGIFDTVSAKYQKPKPPQACEHCGEEEDLIVMKKAKIIICQNCEKQTSFIKPKGLHLVLEATYNTLPSIVKEAFVAAQRLHFKLKDERTKKIICEFYDEQHSIFTSHGYTQIIAKMLTRLSIVWEFKDHGHLLASHIAKDLMTSFSLRDKLFLFIHKNKSQQLRATAIGIIWNRSVRELAKILLIESVENIPNDVIEDQWHNILIEAFKDLNEQEINILEKKLEDQTLLSVLDSENQEHNTDIHCKIIEILLETKSDGHAEAWNEFQTPTSGSSPSSVENSPNI